MCCELCRVASSSHPSIHQSHRIRSKKNKTLSFVRFNQSTIQSINHSSFRLSERSPEPRAKQRDALTALTGKKGFTIERKKGGNSPQSRTKYVDLLRACFRFVFQSSSPSAEQADTRRQPVSFRSPGTVVCLESELVVQSGATRCQVSLFDYLELQAPSSKRSIS